MDLLTTGPLLSVKELAFEMKRHPSYVYAMRQAGFKMPGNRTTLAAALDWLARNPDWRKRLAQGQKMRLHSANKVQDAYLIL